MCTVTAAMMAVTSIAGGMQQMAATQAYNANAAAAHQQERIAATENYKRLQQKADFDNRSINQQGYQQALKGRAARASLQAAAGSSGLAAGSRTLDELEMASYQVSAENQNVIQNKRDDLLSATQYASADAYSRASSNILKLPFKDEMGPLVNMGLGIANAGVKGGVQRGWFT